jgi:aldose sugar dehydrogenase
LVPASTSGSYRLPPFYQIAWLKNSVVERMFPRTPQYTPSSPLAVAVLETSLQRVLVKRLQLPNAAEEFSGGGALATAGDLLYVMTSGGHVRAFDMRRVHPLETAIDTVPINRADLMQSRARYAVVLTWFRSVGAHAEALDDSTQRLFVMHNRFDARNECFTFNISRTTLVRRGDRLEMSEPWRTLYTTAPCMTLQGDEGFGRYPFSGHISGGKMIDFDGKRLLVTVGDFNFDGYLRDAWPMDRSNPYGKFILLDKETGRSEIYAIGARNDMGLLRDSSGTIWATESGPQGGDELNIVERGENYGWPESTYGINYESNPWPLAREQGRHDRYRTPVFAWVPSVVPTNLIRIEGHPGKFDAWRGDLLIASLRGQSLLRLRFDASQRVVYEERIPFGDRIRDMVRLFDGRIALLTDATGYLAILDDGGPEWARMTDDERGRISVLESYDALTAGLPTAKPITDGEGLYGQRCASCHALDGQSRIGPALNGVLGRRIGGLDGYQYSLALTASAQSWSAGELRRYLLAPDEYFPGTRMPNIGLTPEQADSLVAFLQRGAR